MSKFSRAGRPLRQATLSLLCASAWAAAWAAPLAIDLPAQPLGDALKSLARSAGVTIAADGALLAGRQAPAVRGQLELSDGLRQLLRGSGLEFVQSIPGTYLIRAVQLDTVTVKAQAHRDGS
ncbi:MAG: STN domain-containing protein, partial [Comamonas sp.]